MVIFRIFPEIIPEVCQLEGVIELDLLNARSGGSVLLNR